MLAAWAEERRTGAPQATLLGDWLREGDEYENIRAALAGRATRASRARAPSRASRGLVLGGKRLPERRRAWLEDALKRADAADARLRATAFRAVAHLCWRQGDAAATREFGEAGRLLFEELGDRRELGWCLMALAIAAQQEGNMEEAARLFEEIEAIYREVGEESGLAIILNNRGYGAISTGDYERAEALLLEAEQLLRRTGGQYWFILLNLGLLWNVLGRTDEAAAAFREGGDLGLAGADLEATFFALEGLAMVCAARGHDLFAAKVWAAAEVVGEATGYSLQSAEREFHERAVPVSRERAGPEAFDRAWAEGRLLTREQAFALGVESSTLT